MNLANKTDEQLELYARLMTLVVSVVLILSCIGAATVFQSCTTVKESIKTNPEEAGYATGMALYLAYERVSKDKSDEFKSSVAAMWKAIDAMDASDTAALVEAAEAILQAENKADALDKLTPAEKAAIASIARMLLTRLDAYVGSNLESDDTRKFLAGVKDGVNTMIVLTEGSKE